MQESTDQDVLDAVTLELSRFTRDVVAEVHRLRDELVVERRRTDQLESTVQSLTASLRKFDAQAAGIVDYVTELSADIDRRLHDARKRAETSSAESRSALLATGASDSPASPDEQSTRAVRADDLTEPVSGVVDDEICFAPLTLTLDPVDEVAPHDTSIDELVARVVGSIAEPPPGNETIDRTHALVTPT